MLLIVSLYDVRPEHCAGWLELTAEFSAATRAEDGNLWFSWARSVDEDCQFVLTEIWRDDEASRQHLKSPLIPKLIDDMSRVLARRPRLLMSSLPGHDWDEMAQVPIRPDADPS